MHQTRVDHTVDFSKETRQKFFDTFKGTGIVILKGLGETERIDSDREELFRQDSNFYYLTGVNEPGAWAILDLANKKYHLVMPELPDDYKVWMTVVPLHVKLGKYCPDFMHPTNELKSVVAGLVAALPSNGKIYVMDYQKDLSALGLVNENIVDRDELRYHIHECRTIKTPAELAILREASRISSESVVEVMRRIRPGMKEYEVEALWLHECYKRGGPSAKLQAYNPICAAGPSAATLHYVDNDKTLQPGDLFLLDSGAEYRLYASDITRTFPVTGRFTAEQRVIYEIVLNAHKACIEAIRPGVEWADIHRLSMRIVCEGLLKAGFLRGATVEELLQKHVVPLFYPHGVGHFLGIDVHDKGGYPRGVMKVNEPGLEKLRTNRKLQPGMVVTVEPGIYFKDALLEPALTDPKFAPYLNAPLIKKYMSFGGIRIEDDIVVTANGHEDITHVPKEIADIEATMPAQ